MLDEHSAAEAFAAVKKYNLQPKTLDVIRLYYRDGKRICQCAVELGITSQGVHSRLKQAKRELKKKIKRRENWHVIKGFKFKSRLEKVAAYCYFKRGYTHKKTGRIFGVQSFTIQQHVGCVKSRFLLT